MEKSGKLEKTKNNKDMGGIMKAVIIAGGKGERLSQYTKATPKPMLKIEGKPVLEHQIDVLKKYGIRDIYVMTGHLGEVISDYFGTGEKFGVGVTYFKEQEPLGTAGCLKILEEVIKDDFLTIYGDLMWNIKVDDFIRFHFENKSVASLLCHPNDHPFDSDLVACERDGRIVDFFLKNKKLEFYRNLASAAVYILSQRVFTYIEKNQKSDFVKDIFPKMLNNSESLYAYKTAEYVKDMGTPVRLAKVKKDFLSKRIERLAKDRKRPAIFLDRDGTLIEHIDLLHKIEDVSLYPYSYEALKMINGSNYLAILVTNQPVVARNLCGIEDVGKVHDKIETQLGEQGVFLDDIYFCPHHPDKGYPEENKEFKVDCECRKPKTGMLKEAVKKYNIDLQESWMIGDTATDVQTGINAGVSTILLRKGDGLKDESLACQADFEFENIAESVRFIVEGKQRYEIFNDHVLKEIEGADTNRIYVISVGGQSRSGKSVFASALRKGLFAKNIKSALLSLDKWIVPLGSREEGMTVRARYSYSRIEESISKLISNESIKIQAYDSYTRCIKGTVEFSLQGEKVLIIDGVPALDIEGLREVSDLKVYLEIPEKEREKRFYSLYKWKGLPENAVKELYIERCRDEFDIIKESKKYADLIVDKL